MKRPLQLSLAIALALAGTNASALGLGPVRVMSKLNQPLQAEIPVIQGGAGEAEGLLVSLADQEDFEKLGISRSNLGVPLEFSVAKDAHGQTVIRVTSKEPVRSTYLDFLVEANWPKGRMLREYTVLLDPPVTAPAATAPAPAAVAAAPAASAPAKPAVSHPAKPAAEPAPPAAPVEKKPIAHATPAPAPARKVVDGEYGPTKAGETLSAIARETRQGADVNQMMLALLKSNPDAFYRNNINALKRGVILRVPSADEVKAIGSASEAAQQVQAQVEDWRGGRAATTRVASEADKPAPAAAGAKPAKSAAPAVAKAGSKRGDERLELVPPKAGKDSLAMADRPGAPGAGSSSANTEASRELARTKEALAASDQASGELKSRVKDLEDLKSKNERLISLKDSEIAELQQKLKELQSAKGATAPAKPAGDTTAPTAVDKKDIWGDHAKTPAAAAPAPDAKPAETKPADAKPAAPAASIPTDHATSPAATPAAETAKPAAATDKPATATPPATTSTSTTPAPASSTPASSATPAPAASTTPAPTPAETKPLVDHATAPAATTPAKPAPAKPAATQPKSLAQPAWYEADWVKPAAIGGAVVLALLGFLGMRKRKTAAAVATGAGAAAASSIADSFGESPFGANADARNAIEADIENLQDKIASEPHNLGAHLELLSIFYAERDVPRFEEAAEHMRLFVADPHQPEWAEVQAMGEELSPHHPLWTQPGHDVAESVAGFDASHAEAAAHTDFDAESFAFDDHHVAAAAHETHFSPPADVADFGFGVPAAHAADAAPAHAAFDHSFGFDSIPPLGDTQMIVEPEPVAPPSPVAAPAPTPSEDFFADEDAVGTKLDLAKAYMDMGDPDGARSMLEEVVAEGSDAQRAEANRLIAELR